MSDPPVLVVDLRSEALGEDRRALGEDRAAPAPPPDAPLEASETVDRVALLHDGDDEPLLLPIEPTRDRAELDALARLIRFAVVRGERIPTVAHAYGGERERRLLFERRLPGWALDGLAPADLAKLPAALRRALGPPPRR
ncbi:MAG TPA: hypothetical protein RMH99_30530 [Sandaracinaceae bacterium LLY-WYZ-13_1]|nr:hypothetical protein [Sandaracinaceae bacterium LLY-WYZ-13_1]